MAKKFFILLLQVFLLNASLGQDCKEAQDLFETSVKNMCSGDEALVTKTTKCYQEKVSDPIKLVLSPQITKLVNEATGESNEKLEDAIKSYCTNKEKVDTFMMKKKTENEAKWKSADDAGKIELLKSMNISQQQAEFAVKNWKSVEALMKMEVSKYKTCITA